MYPPSMLAAASICAAFAGISGQNDVTTSSKLLHLLQNITNIEPVRGDDFFKNASIIYKVNPLFH